MADHVLSVYWAVKHRRERDYTFFKGLQPPYVKIMDGGRPDYDWVRANLPGSTVVMREWLFDDNNGKVWEACLKAPDATGRQVAGQLMTKAREYGLDPAKTLLMGPVNEPHVWDPGGIEAATKSAVAFADELQKGGWRGLVLNLSVGWPSNSDTATVKNTPPNWTPYEPVRDAIKRGGHTLGLHEYWSETGIDQGWGWLAGRALKCPWDVPIVIGECGMSYAVTRSGIPTDEQGWRRHITKEMYANQLVDYHNRMSYDSRIRGVCVFLCDYASSEWWSKDLEPAYDAVLLRKGQLRKPTPGTPPPVDGVTIVGKVASEAPNDGTTYVYGMAPVGSTIFFSWRGEDAIAAIQSGPHTGYDWKPGYYSIPLYTKGVTPTAGVWDIWAAADGKTSARVPFVTDGKGGKRNQIEVNFAMATEPTTPPVPPTTPPTAPSKGFRFPLDRLTVTQWWSRTHGGIDYSCVQGTPVHACADGVVAWVDDDRTTSAANGGYGLYIRVRHQQLDCDTFYGHLSRQDVKVGDRVKIGQQIGLSGSTGNSTGPHLHFEVRLITDSGAYDKPAAGDTYNARVDPMAWSAGLRAASAKF